MQIHKYMPISDLNKRKNKNNEKWQYPFVRDNKIQQIFNHSSPSITLQYIGINQDIVDRELENFSL